MSTEYIRYPAGVNSGNAVTSLNSLTGAITLAAGPNISITPAGNILTISAIGLSGSYLQLDGANGPMTGLFALSGDAITGLQPVTLNQLNAAVFNSRPLGEVYAATTVSDGNKALTGAVTADGQVVPNGQKVLLQFQTDAKENGIWVVNTGGAWARPSNFANGANAFGAYVSVVNGPTYGAQFRIQITSPCIVGTNNQSWQFQSQSVYLAGAGLTLIANTFSLTAPVTYALGGTNNITAYTQGSVIFAGASSLTQDNANLFYDDTNNRLGIRTAALPRAALTIGAFPSFGTLYPTFDEAGIAFSSSTAALPTKVIIENTVGSGAGSGAGLMLVSRTAGASASGDRLGALKFAGNPAAGTSIRDGARIESVAAAAWTSVSSPAYLDFYTCGVGSNTALLHMRAFPTGGVTVGLNPTSQVGTFNINPLSTASFGLYVKGLASQSGELALFQNSASATIARVSALGSVQGVDLRVLGTGGLGFVEIPAQASNPANNPGSLRIFSDNAARLGWTNYTTTFSSFFDTSLGNADRTFSFQNASYIVANVPLTPGFCKTTGATLTSVANIDLASVSDVGTSVLGIPNGGTGTNALSAGLIVSNGTTLASRYYVTTKTTITQSVATITPTTLTELTPTTNLPAGTYKFSGVLVFQTTNIGTGVGFRLAPGTSTLTSCFGKWNIGFSSNGANHDWTYDQITTTDNVTTTSEVAANTNALATVMGTFTVSGTGAPVIQLRSETGTAVSIRAGSYVTFEAI